MQKTASYSAYLSRILFIVLFVFDAFLIYYVFKDPAACAFGAGAILIAVALLIPFTRASLKAHPIAQAQKYDRDYLTDCYNRVMGVCVKAGYKNINVPLYISDSMTCNAFAVGGSIVVTRGLLDRGHRGYLEAILAHELGHIYHYDSYIKALIEITIVAVLGITLFFILGVIIAFTIIIALFFGFLSSGFLGYAVGMQLWRALKALLSLMLRVYRFIFKAVAAFLYRRQEYLADYFAAEAGYSRPLISFLKASETDTITVYEKPFSETLLDCHPPVYRRIARLESYCGNSSNNSGNGFSHLF